MTLLLNHGAGVNIDISSAEIDYITPLQAAASGGYLEAIKLLIRHEGDIDAVGCETGGLTATQGAAKGGHLGVLKLLQWNRTG